jgi:hypothetical protein
MCAFCNIPVFKLEIMIKMPDFYGGSGEYEEVCIKEHNPYEGQKGV